jgi:trk system potassium uptake protein TrkA
MSKQVVVIGLGRFGSSLALILQEAGYEVLVIDKLGDLVDAISTSVTHAVRANATNESALRKLGINNFDAAVVTMGASIQDSVMATILLKKLGVRYIVARADNELHREILENIGANKVIFPEKDTAAREGPVLMLPDVTDFISIGYGSGIARLQAPAFFAGRTLSDVGFGAASNEVISHEDVLIIAGNNNQIEKIIEKGRRIGEPSI